MIGYDISGADVERWDNSTLGRISHFIFLLFRQFLETYLFVHFKVFLIIFMQ